MKCNWGMLRNLMRWPSSCAENRGVVQPALAASI